MGNKLHSLVSYFDYKQGGAPKKPDLMQVTTQKVGDCEFQDVRDHGYIKSDLGSYY